MPAKLGTFRFYKSTRCIGQYRHTKHETYFNVATGLWRNSTEAERANLPHFETGTIEESKRIRRMTVREIQIFRANFRNLNTWAAERQPIVLEQLSHSRKGR